MASVGANDVKEIQMDVPLEGGGRTSRKRRAGGKRRKTREAGDDATIVTKDSAPAPVLALAPTSAPASVPISAKKPMVILAPPKKKVPKVLLVPKGKVVSRPLHRKTFKAKRFKVTIDNTAKTQKHRKAVVAEVETMTEDQVRAAAVAARLSRRETVAKAPIGLLRQMVKDYRIMKGMLL